MLSAFKSLVYSLLSPIAIPLAYVGAVATFIVSVFRRPEVGLFVLILLIPQPNAWYQLHPYPYGKDLIDFLYFGVILGILFVRGGFSASPNGKMLSMFILVNYFALCNTSIRFSLPFPISTDNELLLDLKNYAEMIGLYFLAYFAVANEKQQKTAVTIALLVILIIAVREFRNFSEGAAFSYDRRAEGPFWIVGLGANHLGAFMAEYGAFALGVFLLDEHKQRRWLALGAALFSVHPLFFSYSRGAYVGALAALVVLGVLKSRMLLGVVVALVFTWQTLLPTTVVERISMTETGGGQLEASAAHRLDLWQHAEDLFHENPIFGVGFGGFGFTVPPGETLTDTHNFYMRTLSEQGVIGIVVLALVLIRALLSGWKLFRVGRSRFHRGIGLGFLACMVACTLMNLFGDRWSYFVLGGYVFVLWGVVDRAVTLSQESEGVVTVADESNEVKLQLTEPNPESGQQS